MSKSQMSSWSQPLRATRCVLLRSDRAPVCPFARANHHPAARARGAGAVCVVASDLSGSFVVLSFGCALNSSRLVRSLRSGRRCKGKLAMAIDPKLQGALALHRFGLGPRPAPMSDIASNPQGALLAELNAALAELTGNDLLPSGEAARNTFAFLQERKAERMAQREPHATMENPENGEPAQDGAAKPGPGIPQQIYLSEAGARYRVALNARIGLTERLGWFLWNHFSVSRGEGG